MNNSNINSESWEESIVLAWWIHVTPQIKGRVLLIGDFTRGTIDYFSQYCDEVCMLSEPDSLDVNKDAVLSARYDSIIIDAVSSNLMITDSFISSLINKSLSIGGHICYLENNPFSLKSNVNYLFKKIINLMVDLRFNSINKLGDKLSIFKIPTVCYENVPHMSFFEGNYATNKNIFLIKEKIRILLLNSRFSRLFVNSNMWLIAKNTESSFFHQNILEFIAEKQDLTSAEYEISSVLYKRGKIIFIYKNIILKRKSFVAVITYEEEEYEQRLNEKKAIEYLGSFDEFVPFLPEQYFEYKYLGYPVFTMHECQGITVDAQTSSMEEMSNNIFEVLVSLSTLTYKHEKNNGVVLDWLKKLKMRAPDEQRNISRIESHINSSNINMSVFMHGDAKIENFVLNKQHKVVGIIDWEQAAMKGFPLIDLYYLIIYNYQIKFKCDFSQAFYALAHHQLAEYEVEILTSYCNKFKISDVQRKNLLVVFFIHHYSCRFHADYKDNYGYSNFMKSLATTMDVIKELT